MSDDVLFLLAILAFKNAGGPLNFFVEVPSDDGVVFPGGGDALSLPALARVAVVAWPADAVASTGAGFRTASDAGLLPPFVMEIGAGDGDGEVDVELTVAGDAVEEDDVEDGTYSLDVDDDMYWASTSSECRAAGAAEPLFSLEAVTPTTFRAELGWSTTTTAAGMLSFVATVVAEAPASAGRGREGDAVTGGVADEGAELESSLRWPLFALGDFFLGKKPAPVSSAAAEAEAGVGETRGRSLAAGERGWMGSWRAAGGDFARCRVGDDALRGVAGTSVLPRAWLLALAFDVDRFRRSTSCHSSSSPESRMATTVAKETMRE